MAAVAAIYPELQQLGAEVLAISTDSVYAHKVFTEVSPSARKVQFPLLSDRTQAICRAYRALNVKTGASFRVSTIVNPEGVIAAKLVYPPDVGRNVYEILRMMEALIFNRQTGAGAPANWMPGQEGIIRDPKLIGTI